MSRMGESQPPPTATEPWPRRLGRLFWITATLVGLLYPAQSVPAMEPVWPAATGLTIFALLYVALIWTGPWPSGDGPGRLRLAGLGLFAVLGVVLALAYAGGPGVGWILVMIYVGAAGAFILPLPRASTTWLVAAAAIQFAIGARHAASDGGTAPDTGLILIVVNTLLLGSLIHAGRRREELVADLRRTRGKLAEAAATTERLRISRDLHDLVGHTLSLIVVKAEVAKRSASQDPPAVPAAAREAGEIEHIGRRALAEMRQAVTGYRQPPFTAELDAARTALADAAVNVTVHTDSTPLPAPVDSLFGWVVREATTNVLRHSGAQHCHIDVRLADNEAILEVRDDGTGSSSLQRRSTGSGLTGLTERLAAAGGRLEAGRSAHGGWQVTATVPTVPAGMP